MTIGSEIRKARKKKGLTAPQLIGMMKHDIASTYISRMEIFGCVPSTAILIDIITVLGLDSKKILAMARKVKIEEAIVRINERYKSEHS